MSVDDELLSTFAMARDPRLRKLFALAGIMADYHGGWGTLAFDGRVREGDLADGLRDVVLDLAPEYLPPDNENDLDDWIAWVRVNAGIQVLDQ